MQLRDLRQGLWHLRHGGLKQYREFAFRAQHGSWTPTRERLFQRALGLAIPAFRAPVFDEVERPLPVPSRPDVRVGVILDTFSKAGFEWEFTCVDLPLDLDAQALAELDLDVVFIESAWHGNDGAWKYKLQGSAGPGPQVRALIDLAKAQNTPVVFWNKEDPPHYEDFLPLARLCDVVFTSDSTMIQRYRAELGHDRVAAMPFAAQPKIHNPIRAAHGWHDRDVAFAGMYFSHKYPERREQMEMLLPAAVSACQTERKKFDIFSRAAGSEEYRFPPELRRHVLGELNYLQMLAVYKRYKVFLNVNSVVDSQTMCSRRVFEMTAAGASVVTAPSPAMDYLFGAGELPIASTTEDATHQIRALLKNPAHAARQVHRAQRNIWRHHTYAHRAHQLLSAAGVIPEASPSSPVVSVVVSSIRPDQLDHVLEGVARQREVTVQLIYGAHGFEVDEEHFHKRCAVLGITDASMVRLSEDKTLGECLNALVEKSSGDIVAKWDDDDVYGPWYLHDQVMALNYSRASVVGKRAHYMQLKGAGATVLRNGQFEHRFTHFVAGPTLLGEREVFVANPFPATTTGEDTAFLRAVLESGGSVYASDRYNYCQIRQAESDHHTWKISTQELLATSEVAFYGDSVEQVFV